MFSYHGGSLYCESVSLADIARCAGTPCYVYSAQSILDAFHAYDDGFGDVPHAVCYAVKANATLGVLSLLARAGAWFDIVSGGELFRVLEAGGDASRVVFSGVGKTAEEVDFALDRGIHSFNCESEGELALIDALAGERGLKAKFSLRLNPDVDASTHPYIATGLSDHKFGFDLGEAAAVYERSRLFKNLAAEGVSCHIGSQLLDTAPILEAVEKVLGLAVGLRSQGHGIRHVDLGGGLGVAYKAEDQAPEIRNFVSKLSNCVRGSGFAVMVEPGRSIVGPAGMLLTRVLNRKRTPKKEFVIVDAAMNDLIRPSLYQSHHDIIPVKQNGSGTLIADVVGPICETGDFLARDRSMADVAPGEYLAVCTAGAYAFAQSSNYNSRPRAPEVLVEGDRWRVIRDRETFQDLIRGEKV
ncbi:MAG: diaminopimelate decarboxylase [Acidobacteriota bacterium]|nr:diaminopimelate decarboxylase [Acidobacteriota bacterium]